MAKTILSFEEYNSEIKGKQTDTDVAEEVITEECDICEEDPCTCETTGMEEDDSDDDDSEDVDDDSDDDDDDDDDSEDDDDADSEDDDDDDDDDDGDDEVKLVSEMLKEAYESACTEAEAYEGDDYPEHTVETYVKEMSSLNAGMMSEMYEAACASVKEGDMTIETYEATCNEMKEAFCKRMDEMKEAWSAK
jgi:hypothetical protein